MSAEELEDPQTLISELQDKIKQLEEENKKVHLKFSFHCNIFI